MFIKILKKKKLNTVSTRLIKIIDKITAPGAPVLIPEECSAENNSVTVAWQPPGGHGVGCGQRAPAIEGYLLELDDGCGGEFRVRIENQRSITSRYQVKPISGKVFNSCLCPVQANRSPLENPFATVTLTLPWFLLIFHTITTSL